MCIRDRFHRIYENLVGYSAMYGVCILFFFRILGKLLMSHTGGLKNSNAHCEKDDIAKRILQGRNERNDSFFLCLKFHKKEGNMRSFFIFSYVLEVPSIESRKKNFFKMVSEKRSLFQNV